MSSTTQLQLAIHGGSQVRTDPFPAYNTIGAQEKEAAIRVLDSGVLSNYLGCWHENFYGGTEVQAFEAEWASHFNVKHAISVNSATSALFAAVGAVGVEPGDEVIVSPFTMTASAVGPLIYGAIPVFADVEPDFYCLDPKSVEACITEHTKAIIVVDIFGQPYDVEGINTLAEKYDLAVIEDCAQAPGAKYGNQFAGTLGDIGIYSLNYHKHIHTGEGGMLVTDNDDLAERLKLIRNHAEAVLNGKYKNKHEWTPELLSNMVGFNYRMTEIEAAIGREQLKKLDGLLEERLKNVDYLNKALEKIPCIETTKVRPNATHAYYVHPLEFNEDVAGISRDTFIQAVKAELAPMADRKDDGVHITCGYLSIHKQPMFQKKIAFGTKGYPWNSPLYNGNVTYDEGICPVTDQLNTKRLFHHDIMLPPLTQNDLDDVITAFTKVWENRHQLTSL